MITHLCTSSCMYKYTLPAIVVVWWSGQLQLDVSPVPVCRPNTDSSVLALRPGCYLSVPPQRGETATRLLPCSVSPSPSPSLSLGHANAHSFLPPTPPPDIYFRSLLSPERAGPESGKVEWMEARCVSSPTVFNVFPIYNPLKLFHVAAQLLELLNRMYDFKRRRGAHTPPGGF